MAPLLRRLPTWVCLSMMGLWLPLAAWADDAESLYYEQDYAGAYDAYGERLGREKAHRDKLEYGAGTAAYKAERFVDAAEHLGRAILTEDAELRGKAYYNLGNTLFRLGKASQEPEAIISQWEEAVRHYREAESLGGAVASNATTNREIVEKHLEALKEQQQQEEQQQEQQQQSPEEEESQEEQPQDGEGEQEQEQSSSEDSQDGEDPQRQEQEPQEGSQQQEDQQSQEGQEQQQEGQEQQDGQEQEEGQEGQQGQEGEEGEGDEGEPLGEKEGQQGEVKQMEQPGEEGDPSEEEVSAYELTPDGKLSEAAARALLESLEGQEVKAPFEIRRSRQRQRVLRNW